MKSQRHRGSVSIDTGHDKGGDINRIIIVEKWTPEDVRFLVVHGPDRDLAIEHSSGAHFLDQFISEDPAPAVRNDGKDFIVLQYVPSREVDSLSYMKGRPNSFVTRRQSDHDSSASQRTNSED